MHLRKKKNRPYVAELHFHSGKEDDVIRFAADAGGTVRSWINALRASAWHTTESPCDRCCGENADEIISIKLLLPRCMFSKPYLLARRTPRTLVMRACASTCTLDCMREFIQRCTGLPEYCAQFMVKNRRLHDDSCSLIDHGIDDRSHVSVTLKELHRFGEAMSSSRLESTRGGSSESWSSQPRYHKA